MKKLKTPKLNYDYRKIIKPSALITGNITSPEIFIIFFTSHGYLTNLKL